jgi:AcrR family transcriptional regulator
MTDLDEAAEPVDGRVARRQRNIDSVVDVVIEMFGEESLFPTIEQAATRSGLSLRSLYRYFADPGELHQAAIRRSRVAGTELSRLHDIGGGPFARRLEDFVGMRLRLHEAVGPVYRATVANAAKVPALRDELAKNRNDMREQFELQFAPELAACKPADRHAVMAAGDLLTQLDSIDLFRRNRQLSVAETESVLVSSLQRLLR